MGAGGSQGSSVSNTQSGSGSISGSYIDPSQLSGLQSLWAAALGQANPAGATAGANAAVSAAQPGINAGLGAASALAGGRMPGAFGTGRDMMTGAGAGLGALASGDIGGGFGRGQGMIRGAARGLAGDLNRPQRMMTNATRNLLAMGDPSRMYAQEKASLQSGLGQMWNETVMPGIKSGAMAGGGFGGGRQGVAEGVGAGQMGKAFQQGLGDIFSRSTAAATAANQGANAGGAALGQLGLNEAGMLGQLGNMMSQLGLGAAGAQTAAAGTQGQIGSNLTQAGIDKGQLQLGAGTAAGAMGQGLMGLLTGAANAGMGPLGMLAQILGNPAILQTAISGSQSSGSSNASDQSFNFSMT